MGRIIAIRSTANTTSHSQGNLSEQVSSNAAQVNCSSIRTVAHIPTNADFEDNTNAPSGNILFPNMVIALLEQYYVAENT